MPRAREGKVRFLVKPDLRGSAGWLAFREGLVPRGADAAQAARGLAERFSAIQVWFSDLDDFDTRSPAKIIALRAVGAGHLNPAYARWVLRTLICVLRNGWKRAQAICWKRYYEAFLKEKAEGDWLKDEAFRFVDELLDRASIEALLYPGVADFYRRFGAEKYLVTRNLERIAFRYSKVLPYTAYFHEVEDKAALVEAFVESRPDVRRYGLGGDSEEDARAADALEALHRKGRIDMPVCLFRAPSPFALDKAFNLFVGKDRSALARVLAR